MVEDDSTGGFTLPSPVGSILRAATRKKGEPLNVLVCPTHERTEVGISRCNARFWAVRGPQVKDWNTAYAPVPDNYILLNPDLGEAQLPPEVEFDVVLSQNKFGQFQLLSQFAHKLHVPLISYEHTLPVPEWGKKRLADLKGLRGNANVFISEFSREEWGWGENEALVIHHGVDTEVFSPDDNLPKKPHVLSVVNDWVNRDWCCGYRVWEEATRGLPVLPVGATPGLSKPAKDVTELVRFYREARVFMNTSLVSPIPTSLLEAMACGAACVSMNTSWIPSVIEHGVNGLLGSNPKELRGLAEDCLRDDKLCETLGQNARKTIIERFSMGEFVRKWDELFVRVASVPYTGVF